jgi:hypothetical protein
MRVQLAAPWAGAALMEGIAADPIAAAVVVRNSRRENVPARTAPEFDLAIQLEGGYRGRYQARLQA